ncbi:hypothetical protein D3C72_2137520 [compost metagenome]
MKVLALEGKGDSLNGLRGELDHLVEAADELFQVSRTARIIAQDRIMGAGIEQGGSFVEPSGRCSTASAFPVLGSAFNLTGCRRPGGR